MCWAVLSTASGCPSSSRCAQAPRCRDKMETNERLTPLSQITEIHHETFVRDSKKRKSTSTFSTYHWGRNCYMLYSEKIRNPVVGCTPKGAYGNTAFWEGFWEGSGKGSGEGVLRRVLRRGGCCGFYSKEGFWEGFSEGVLRRGVSRRCLERPLEEYAPLGVHPNVIFWKIKSCRETGFIKEIKSHIAQREIL